MLEHYTAQLKNDLHDAGYDGMFVANIHPGPVKTGFEDGAQITSNHIKYFCTMLHKMHHCKSEYDSRQLLPQYIILD